MPAVVGAIQIITVSSSSIFNIGDVYMMSPYTSAKTFAGGGSFNTGTKVNVKLEHSDVKLLEQDAIDQPIVGE